MVKLESQVSAIWSSWKAKCQQYGQVGKPGVSDKVKFESQGSGIRSNLKAKGQG